MKLLNRAAGAKLRWMLPLLAILPLFSYGVLAALKPFLSKTGASQRDLVHLLVTHLPWSPVARPSHSASPPAGVRPQIFPGTQPSQEKTPEKPQAGMKSGNKSHEPRKPSWSRPPAPSDPLDLRRVAIST